MLGMTSAPETSRWRGSTRLDDHKCLPQASKPGVVLFHTGDVLVDGKGPDSIIHFFH